MFRDGRSFCTNEDYQLQYYINRQQVSDIRDYEIMEDDKILVYYGEASPDQIEAALLELDAQELIK